MFLGISLHYTDIYITVPSLGSFPEISVSSVSKNDRVTIFTPNIFLKVTGSISHLSLLHGFEKYTAQ